MARRLDHGIGGWHATRLGRFCRRGSASAVGLLRHQIFFEAQSLEILDAAAISELPSVRKTAVILVVHRPTSKPFFAKTFMGPNIRRTRHG